MFEISWSEILVIGVVALIVVGPKELPVLLRTVGRYMGIIKRQAAEFRAQFDEAMRESEFDQIRKDVESIKTDAENTMRDAERSVHNEMADARREFDATTDSIKLDHQPSDKGVDHGAGDHPADGHRAVEHHIPVPEHDISTSLPMSEAPVEAPHELTSDAAHAGSGAIAAAAAAAASAPAAPASKASSPTSPAHEPPAREPAKTGA